MITAASTLASLSRRRFVVSSVGILSTFLSPNSVLAASKEIGYTLSASERISVAQSGFMLRFTDNQTGEVTCAELGNNGEVLRIIHPDGTVSYVFQSDVATYLDGELIAETISPQNDGRRRAAPAGYTLFLTRNCAVSAYSQGMDIIIAAFGNIPVVGQVINFFYQMRDRGLDNMYMTLYQYRNASYRIYSVVKIYRYSNYTGLVKTIEYGPYNPV